LKRVKIGLIISGEVVFPIRVGVKSFLVNEAILVKELFEWKLLNY
jgi:hypothetical protein